jgi:uncharacterized protein (DUF305 family)
MTDVVTPDPDRSDGAAMPSGGLLIWPRVVALVVAVSFFVGVVGYRIGLPDGRDLNEVDIGFLADMSTHHEGAITLAFAYLPNANDAVINQIAGEIIRTQSIEINFMNVILQDSDDDRISEVVTDNIAMEWMNDPVIPERMPGLATAADYEELRAASGVDADDIFTMLMIDHHAAGAVMADFEAANGNDDTTRKAARSMANIQRVEIAELNTRREALGLEPYRSEDGGHGASH